MSAGPWTKPETLPHGFRVTIERKLDGKTDCHVVLRKVPRRAGAIQAATYKKGFLRILSCEPLTREEWDRESGKAATR